MKEKPLMAFLMERGVRENYSFFLPIKRISPKRDQSDQSEKSVAFIRISLKIRL